MHKGFKCLDPSSERVYISRDIVFDETIFLFSTLHPNIGARLRKEIDLLPDVLKNSSSEFGSVIMHDQSLINSLLTDALSSAGGVNNDAGTNLVRNGEERTTIRPHFMQSGGDNSSTGPGADPPEPRTDSAGESASGATTQVISPGSAAQQLLGAADAGSYPEWKDETHACCTPPPTTSEAGAQRPLEGPS
jgi:hypothetical protein